MQSTIYLFFILHSFHCYSNLGWILSNENDLVVSTWPTEWSWPGDFHQVILARWFWQSQFFPAGHNSKTANSEGFMNEVGPLQRRIETNWTSPSSFSTIIQNLNDSHEMTWIGAIAAFAMEWKMPVFWALFATWHVLQQGWLEGWHSMSVYFVSHSFLLVKCENVSKETCSVGSQA